MRAVALRYALALACVLLAVLVQLSPAGSLFPYGGLFFLAVVGAAWFGGAGPGFLTAALGAVALPQLIPVSHTVLGGFLDLPRLVVFSIAGLAVGWWSFRRRQVEAALRESEKRFRSLTELSNDFFWQTDTEHRYTLLDFGLIHRGSHEKWKKLGKRPWEIPSTSPDEAGWAAHRATIDERKPFVDFAMSRVDRGEERFYEISGEPRFDADGTFLGYRGVGRETTARVRAEQAFRQSQESYALAVDATGAGHWDWKIPSDEFYASPRHLEIGGFAPDAKFASRAEFAERYPFHPEDRPKWQAAMDAHFSGKTPRIDIEVRILPKGEPRWVRMIGQLQRDHLGRPLRYAGVSIDTTEAKLAEQALRESEERYELAMAASESGYWDWDVLNDRFFASARANELAGFAADATFVDRGDFRTRIPAYPEDFAKWEAAREALFAGTGDRLAMELRYHVHGKTLWAALKAICKRDDTGKVVRWIGSTTDVTERKRAEEELRAMELKLRQAQRLESMGTFAGGIAHDFNNILGAILGFGELALRAAPKGSRLAGDLESIMTAGERGRALVGRLLSFSRSVVGERVPVHVERVVREALDVVSARLPPGVTVQAQLHAGRAAILGDATQVHQVVTNLATNAVHAMPAGGMLRVELASVRVGAPRPATIGGLAVGEYVMLTVADTGAGIPPEIMERIFDPFFTTKEVGTGTGLGLSLVHGIVTELGGCIDLATKVGAGTTFTVYLPRSGEAAAAEDDAQLALPRGEGQRVLVVDDEEPLVRHATRTLEELGYAPVGFTSSSDALAALRADPERFDALITDERMPGVSGSALIREVRGIRSSMPVVLMSGYLGPTADKVRESGLFHTLGMSQKIAAAIGADEVLQKPLSSRDLATSLARVLRL